MAEKTNQLELLPSGEYEFRISDVIALDREGNELKTQHGAAYKRIRLSVIDKDGSIKHVYAPVFNSKKVQQVLRCVGRNASPDLDILESLIGTGGTCFITIRKGKEGFDDQNEVDCYVQKEPREDLKAVFGATMDIPADKLTTTHNPVNGISHVKQDAEEDIPF